MKLLLVKGAGELQIAKIHEVPVLVKELTDEEVVKISIIENIQRVDLNPIEEANSFDR